MSEHLNVPQEGGPNPSTPRGTGWKPQAPSELPAESSSPLSPSLHNEPPPFRSTMGPARTPKTLWFWGVVIFIALCLSLLLGPDAYLDIFVHRAWDIGHLSFCIIPVTGIFAIGMFARSWQSKGIPPVRGTREQSTGYPVQGKRNVILRGEVRGFRERVEQHGSTQYGSRAPDIVWSFRVERYQDGHRLPPLPVEMRGVKFKGLLSEGDTVEIYEPWREGETIRPKHIFNVTNNAKVSTEKGALGPLGLCGIVMIIWIVLMIIVFAVLAAISVFR